MITEDINLDDIIADKLKLKYKMFNLDEIKSIANMGIDSIFPTIFVNQLTNKYKKCKKTGSNFAFSEFIANKMNVRHIEVNELFTMFDINAKKIKQQLIKLKKKKINLVMIGFGGGGINFWYWLERILNHTLVFNVFESIVIYDNDDFDLTNLPRIPYDLRTKDLTTLKKVLLAKETQVQITNNLLIMDQKFAEEKISQNDSEQTIYIGGPDIKTRKILSESNEIFLSVTHGDNELGIYLNPLQDSSLQVESYGTIELNYFYLNQFAATIALINYFADEDLDLSQVSELRHKSEDIITINAEKIFDNDKYVFNGKTYRFKPQFKTSDEEINND